MERQLKYKVKGFNAIDGAGVHLVRVLGGDTTEEFDPILMLDSFDSTNPDDYTRGFPMHPHRGIETISYLSRGKMVHRDSLGNEAAIGDGEVQWMNSGSGILHEEMVPEADRLLGVQLWLNLPKKDKMSQPSYHSIEREDIQEIPVDGGMVRLLAGSYEGHEGYKGQHLPLDYYDVHLDQGKELVIETDPEASIMLFTLLGDAIIAGQEVEEKTAVKLTPGDKVRIQSPGGPIQVLYMASVALEEPVAWAGPIVMNTEKELEEAFSDLNKGSFIREKVDY